MKQNRKERILNLIKRKNIDRLPSDIWLSNRPKDKLLQKMMINEEELKEILDTHIIMVYSLDNHMAWDNEDSLSIAIKRKYFKLDKEKEIIYDNWGVGWDISREGIYEVYNPLNDTNNLDNYFLPDPTDKHLFDCVIPTVEKYQNQYCIAAIQDLTLFERACAIRGFTNFLLDIKTRESFAEELLD